MIPLGANCHRAPAISPLTGKPMQPATCTVDEAARIAGVSPRTIRRWIARRWLPATRTDGGWSIRMTDIDDAKLTARIARLALHKRRLDS